MDTVDPKKLAGGYKADEHKPRMDLIPPEVPYALAVVLAYGASKYVARNWEKGMSWGRPFAAAMRHLWAWWGGSGPTPKSFLFGDLDAETKFSHLWHALACLSFLVAYEERGMKQFDDRFTRPEDIEAAKPKPAPALDTDAAQLDLFGDYLAKRAG